MPARSSSMRRMQWAAVVLCAAAIAINYLDRSTLAVGGVEIRHEFAINATQFGALQSAWSICYAFAQIPIGLFVDRLGPGVLLGVALILWSVAQAAGGVVTSYAQLFAARAALGVTESPAYPTAVRVTSDWFQVRDRGTPTGVFNMGAGIGTAIAPPLLTALMLPFGWRIMFVVMGVAGVVAAIAWFWLYRDVDNTKLAPDDAAYLRANRSGRDAADITARQWSRLFGFRTTWGMILGSFCSGYGIWMYVTWLPGYLEGEHHISIASTGYLASIPLTCSILGSFCGGYTSDRLIKGGMGVLDARRFPTSLGYLCSALFTALAASVSTPGPAIVCISLAMFCLSFAVAAKWTLITAVAPQNYCASFSSIQNFGSYVGGTCSPVITGLVVDLTGSFVLALAIGAVVMMTGSAIYQFAVGVPVTEADLEGPGAPVPALTKSRH
jgi:MFS transporter, ACS family, L-galactonate transporter